MVYTISWFLAGGLAGFAGALLTLQLPGGVNSGNDLIVEIFAASVLGGLTSIFGSAVGGLVIGGTEILVTNWLGLGFGLPGTGVLVAVILLAGALLIRQGGRRRTVAGVILAGLGIWIIADIAAGYPVDFLAAELVNGFGPNVTPYQLAIPLVIMAATLLVAPQGIFSVDIRQMFRRAKK